MNTSRCPGQDSRNWKPEDNIERKCPGCGYLIELWKDEPERACPKCKRKVRNPKLDPGCAKWCPHAKECLEGFGFPPAPPEGTAGGSP